MRAICFTIIIYCAICIYLRFLFAIFIYYILSAICIYLHLFLTNNGSIKGRPTELTQACCCPSVYLFQTILQKPSPNYRNYLSKGALLGSFPQSTVSQTPRAYWAAEQQMCSKQHVTSVMGWCLQSWVGACKAGLVAFWAPCTHLSSRCTAGKYLL